MGSYCLIVRVSVWDDEGFFFGVVVFLFFYLFRAAPTAHGGSQGRGWIRAVAAILRHSHSNTRSELCLQPTTAHSDAGSLSHWARPGIELTTSWFLVGFVSTVPWQELLPITFNIILYRSIKSRHPYLGLDLSGKTLLLKFRMMLDSGFKIWPPFV